VFDASGIRTYPVAERTNKVTLRDLAEPVTVRAAAYDVGPLFSGKSLLRVLAAGQTGRYSPANPGY
jgi:hypothetical protein